MDERLYFSGKIGAVFFSNPSNLYKVLLLEIDETNDEAFEDSEIVVTGTIGEVVEAESYRFYGRISHHPRYGEQLQAETYEKIAPTSINGLIKYLSSENFPGIGKETAKKIVKAYPKNTVDAILEDPRGLTGILTDSKKEAFLKNLSTNHGMERILSKLYGLGLTGRLAAQIYRAYQVESLDVLKNNPYQLIEEIEGLGFLTADKIAAENGIRATSAQRLRAALLHSVIEQPNLTGDTYIERIPLLHLARELLQTTRPSQISLTDLEAELTDLIDQGKLVQSQERIFEKSLAEAEESVASNISRLLKQDKEIIVSSEFTEAIKKVEAKLSISYDDLQKEAIYEALESPLFILTGGPGTGKTTIINGFLQVYAELHQLSLEESDYSDALFPYILAAPTGRASRRLSELSGLSAATLHRTLGINSDDDDEDLANDLSGQVLIVDEFSMVDTWLAHKLFNAIPSRMKVLIVGDADQLASVGPGQILSDLLAYSKIPSKKLDRIYRQSEDSTITSLAHAIKDGNLPNDLTERKADRNFFSANAYQVADLIGQIASSWQKKGKDPFDFQVLIPMYKGPSGITAVNKALQEIFNPKGEEIEFSFMEGVFRKADKILQLVNDAENNVFNGDIGQIVDLIPAKYSDSKQDELVIDFDGLELNYLRSDWINLRLAYAMSIHKSQGSEFETVVVPMVSSYARMLQRNLVYTAVTRARQSLILLGEIEAFRQAVAKEGSNRKTGLFDRLVQYNGDLRSSKAKPIEGSEPKLSSTKEETEVAATLQLLEERLVERGPLTLFLIEEGQIDPLIGLSESDFEIFLKHEHFLNLP